MNFSFLEEFAETVSADNDIERYFTTSVIKAVLDPKENQVQWVLNWWLANKQEYSRIYAIARDRYSATPFQFEFHIRFAK